MNYLIVGTESYLINKKLTEILSESGASTSELNVGLFDATANDFSIQSVIDDCNTPPFFGDKKVVIIKNPNFLSTTKSLNDKELALLEEYIKDPSSDCDLIFCGALALDKRKKIVKIMQKECQYFQLDKLALPEFQNYVRKELKNNSLNITSKGLEELFSRIPLDLDNFYMELQKLSLYEGELGKEVISKLITRPLDEDVFHLVNAVVSKDLKTVFHVWRDLSILNKDPIYLIALLSSQFRLLYQIKVYLDLGMNQKMIQDHIKVHPYRVKKAIESLRGLSKERLLELLNSLAELDQNFKKGILDKSIGFELFLIKTAR